MYCLFINLYAMHITFTEWLGIIAVFLLIFIIIGILFLIFTKRVSFQNSQNLNKRLSENHLSLLEDYNGMVYRCLDDSFWTIKYASAKTFELTGYFPNDLIDNHLISYNDLILPKYRDSLQAKWSVCLTNHEDLTVEYEILTKDGQVKWVEEFGHGIYDQKGNVLFLEGYIHDISRYKEVIVNERKNYVRFQNLIENSQDAIYIDEEGLITYANPACVRFFGASSEKYLINKKVESFLTEDYVPFYFDRVKRIHKDKTSNPTALYEFKRFDGSLATAEVSSSPFYDQESNKLSIFVFVKNVTEKIERDKELKKLMKRNRDLVVEMKEGIAVFEFNSLHTPILIFQNKSFSIILYNEYKKLLDSDFSNVFPFIPAEEYRLIFDVITSGNTLQKQYQNGNQYLDFRFFTNVDHELVVMLSDVTEQVKTNEKLHLQAKKINNIIKGAKIGLWEWNVSNHSVDVNEQFLSLLGYSPSEILLSNIKQWQMMIHPDDIKSVFKYIKNNFKNREEYFEVEYRMLNKNGLYVWFIDRGNSTYKGHELYPRLVFGTHQDISDRKEKEAKLEYVSSHDYLTGLHNRRSYQNYIQSIYEKKILPFTIIMGDVDRLKFFNDEYGHHYGDELLITVASILKESVTNSFVCRYGGDEFIIVLTHVLEQQVVQIIETIQRKINDVTILGHHISVSLGYSINADYNKSIKEIEHEAENQMYSDKIKTNNIK